MAFCIFNSSSKITALMRDSPDRVKFPGTLRWQPQLVACDARSLMSGSRMGDAGQYAAHALDVPFLSGPMVEIITLDGVTAGGRFS
jgi:hypothetical protein